MQPSLLTINAVVIAILIFHGLLIVAILKRVDEMQILIRSVDVPAAGGLLQRGSAAPAFRTELAGSSMPFSLDSLQERGGVLVFMSAKCDACERLARQLAIDDEIDGIYLILLGDSPELCTLLGSKYDTVTKDATHIASAYRISNFPSAVGIDRAGRIAAYNHPHDRRDLQRLLKTVVVDAADEQQQRTIHEERLTGARA